MSENNDEKQSKKQRINDNNISTNDNDISTNDNNISTNDISTNDSRIEIIKNLINNDPETTFLYVLWLMGDGLGHDQIYSKDLIKHPNFWVYSKNCVPESQRDIYMEKVKNCTNNVNTKAIMNAYSETIKAKFGMYSGSISFIPEEFENGGGYNGNWKVKKNYNDTELQNQNQDNNEDIGFDRPATYFLNKLGTEKSTLASIDSVTGHKLKEELGEFNTQSKNSFGTNFATQSADPATSDVNTLKKYGFEIANNRQTHSDNIISGLEEGKNKAMFIPFKIDETDKITLSELGYVSERDVNSDIVFREITFQNKSFRNPKIRVEYSSTGITIENVRAVDKSLANFIKEYIDNKKREYKIINEIIDKKRGQEKKITIKVEDDFVIINIDAGETSKFRYYAKIPRNLFIEHPILVRITLLFLKTCGDYSFSRTTWLDKTFTSNDNKEIVSKNSNKIILSIDELAVEFTSLMSNFKFGIRTYQSDTIEILLANLKEQGNQEQLIEDCSESIKKLSKYYSSQDIEKTKIDLSSRSSSEIKSEISGRILLEKNYVVLSKYILKEIENSIRIIFQEKFGDVKSIIKDYLKFLTNKLQTKSDKDVQNLFRYGMIECFIRKYIKQAKLNIIEKYKQPNCIYNFEQASEMLESYPSSVFNLRKIYESAESYEKHISGFDLLELNIRQDITKLTDYFFDKRYKDIYTGNAFIEYVFKFFYEIVPLNNYDSIMAAGHASLLDISLYSRVSTRSMEIEYDNNLKLNSGKSIASSVKSLFSQNTKKHIEKINDESKNEKDINLDAVEKLKNIKCEESNYKYDFIDEDEDDDEYTEFTNEIYRNITSDKSIESDSQGDSEYSVSQDESKSETSFSGSPKPNSLFSPNTNQNLNKASLLNKLSSIPEELEDEIILFGLPEQPFTIKELVQLNIKNYGPHGVSPTDYKKEDYVKYFLKGISRVSHYLFYSNVDEMKIIEQQENIIDNIICENNLNEEDTQNGGSDSIPECNLSTIKIICNNVITELCNEMGYGYLNRKKYDDDKYGNSPEGSLALKTPNKDNNFFSPLTNPFTGTDNKSNINDLLKDQPADVQEGIKKALFYSPEKENSSKGGKSKTQRQLNKRQIKKNTKKNKSKKMNKGKEHRNTKKGYHNKLKKIKKSRKNKDKV